MYTKKMARAKLFTKEDVQEQISTAILVNEVKGVKDALGALTTKIDETFVTRQEFAPIKSVVYGLVALILTGFGSAVIYLAINTNR